MVDLKELISIEKFMSKYICEFDKQLFSVENKLPSKNTVEILKAGWATISKNSAWYLANYRANVGDDNSTIPVPYYELCFACRILLETSSDIWYLLQNDNAQEVEKFLSEKKSLEEDFDSTIQKTLKNDYSKEYSLQKKTMPRIKDCYGEQGIAQYNALCWNTHFNYVGYSIAKNDLFTYKMRIYNLLSLLGAVDKYFDSINKVCDLTEFDALTKMRNSSDEIAERIKILVKKEASNE